LEVGLHLIGEKRKIFGSLQKTVLLAVVVAGRQWLKCIIRDGSCLWMYVGP